MYDVWACVDSHDALPKKNHQFFCEKHKVWKSHTTFQRTEKIKTNTRKRTNDYGNRKERKGKWQWKKEWMRISKRNNDFESINIRILHLLRVYFVLIWIQTNLFFLFFFANGITVKWGEQIFLPAVGIHRLHCVGKMSAANHFVCAFAYTSLLRLLLLLLSFECIEKAGKKH